MQLTSVFQRLHWPSGGHYYHRSKTKRPSDQFKQKLHLWRIPWEICGLMPSLINEPIHVSQVTLNRS